MADNVPYTPGAGTSIASDEIGGAHYQRVKLTLGADGVNDGDVSSANPIPTGAADGAIVALGATTDASAAADNSNVGLIALFKRLLARLTTLLGAGNASLASIDGKLSGALNVTGSTVGVTGNVEVVNDVGNPLPVSGTVALSTAVNLEATQLLVKAKTDNLDVLLSTRLKPADTLTGVTTVATVTNLAQLGGQAVAMGTGVRSAGTVRVTVATDDLLPVGGDVAHDAVDAGNPVKVGGKAISGFAAAVSAAADRVQAWFDLYGRQVIAKRDNFAVNNAPAVATAATIAKAAGGAGVKNVCTSIAITISSTAAPTAGSVLFNLRDGATGAGTILWSARLSIAAVAGNGANLALSDLWIEGTANTVMTLETSAAPAANTFATVAMTGTITQ